MFLKYSMKKLFALLVLVGVISSAFAINERFLFVLVKHEVPVEVRQAWVSSINTNMGFTNNEITLSMFVNTPLTNVIGETWDRSVWYKTYVSDKFTPEKIQEIQTLIGTNLIRIIKTNNPELLEDELGLFNIITNTQIKVIQ